MKWKMDTDSFKTGKKSRIKSQKKKYFETYSGGSGFLKGRGDYRKINIQ